MIFNSGFLTYALKYDAEIFKCIGISRKKTRSTKFNNLILKTPLLLVYIRRQDRHHKRNTLHV